MKKVILTTAAFVLVGGGAVYAAYGNSDKTPVEDDTITNYHEQVKTEHENINDYAEYDTLSDVIDMDGLNAEVVEDNAHKRVILLKDDNGHPVAKSIFIMDDSRLKVIDFDKGKVFDDVIGEDSADGDNDVSKEEEGQHSAESSDEADTEKNSDKVSVEDESTDFEGMDEYATIAKKVDVDKYEVKVVEDNPYKRIILLEDANGNPDYKTIFIKNKSMLKIIDLHGGLVFHGAI